MGLAVGALYQRTVKTMYRVSQVSHWGLGFAQAVVRDFDDSGSILEDDSSSR